VGQHRGHGPDEADLVVKATLVTQPPCPGQATKNSVIAVCRSSVVVQGKDRTPARSGQQRRPCGGASALAENRLRSRKQDRPPRIGDHGEPSEEGGGHRCLGPLADPPRLCGEREKGGGESGGDGQGRVPSLRAGHGCLPNPHVDGIHRLRW